PLALRIVLGRETLLGLPAERRRIAGDVRGTIPDRLLTERRGIRGRLLRIAPLAILTHRLHSLLPHGRKPTRVMRQRRDVSPHTLPQPFLTAREVGPFLGPGLHLRRAAAQPRAHVLLDLCRATLCLVCHRYPPTPGPGCRCCGATETCRSVVRLAAIRASTAPASASG